MESSSPQLFDAHHGATGSGSPYCVDEQRLADFGRIADRIISDIQPKTVLDAGCANGFLVESLRSRAVQAYGVDASEYAVQNISADIRPYCRQGAVTDPFPQRYDLIVSIGVLEHLPTEEAQAAIANICQYTDDILFSATPVDYEEATHLNVQPLDYWAEQFARHAFYRDLDYDASYVTPWAVRFRRSRAPLHNIVRQYDRQHWMLDGENRALRSLAIENRQELASRLSEQMQVESLKQRVAIQEQTIQSLTAQLQAWQVRQAELEATAGWRVLRGLQSLRGHLAPPASRRDRLLDDVIFHLRHVPGARRAGRPALKSLTQSRTRLADHTITIEPVVQRPPLEAHRARVDVVICIHNALTDVQRCLDSVLAHTSLPFNLILVDDGSAAETRDFLTGFAQAHQVTLLRNDDARGYTRAANQGLRAASGEYAIFLNSDTIVTPRWVDRMVACAESNPRIGLVGPLSNTASWQSVPRIEQEGDWAENPLPEGMTVAEMGELVAASSGRVYPLMPLLNGFCLLVRRQTLVEVGPFDEECFGEGYGEEDDFALRARKAGWLLALADDTYIFHAQSRSYSNERRAKLTQRAGLVLREKHGEELIAQGVDFCANSRVLKGIRARAQNLEDRRTFIRKGAAEFAGRCVLIVLPIATPGGGGNVALFEALAMQKMGVQVEVFNLESHRAGFSAAYPNFPLPVIYGRETQVAEIGASYDAVIATYNTSVAWLAALKQRNGYPVRGYYVQGFEPYMYLPDSADYRNALTSYSLFPDLVRFTKTEWTRQEVLREAKVDSTVVGVSVDTDLFRPRPCLDPEWPNRPLRVSAMIRSGSPYREPELTMEVFRQAAQTYGNDVEIRLFGVPTDDPWFQSLPNDFTWQNAGVLHQRQVASLLNETDIFVDFSSHQAMGLTALEAMCCGAAVIVPSRGGAVSFAHDNLDSLVVDTSSRPVCWKALQRLIEDHALRSRLRESALTGVCAQYPERPAYNSLCALFSGKGARSS